MIIISCSGRLSKSLDEAPELGPHLLDALRTPLEEGQVRLSRTDGTVSYPARFQLVMAANSCPCASPHDRDCICPSLVRRRYLGRLSGPLLDRVDLHARMFPITTFGGAAEPGESTAVVRGRVLAAREAAAERWAEESWVTNVEVPGPAIVEGAPSSCSRAASTASIHCECAAACADRLHGVGGERVPARATQTRHRFLARNRIVAALGTATVVGEAGMRSGSLRSARDAQRLGRAVLAVPGPVTSAVSVGCHRLIRDGAELVTCAADVLDHEG